MGFQVPRPYLNVKFRLKGHPTMTCLRGSLVQYQHIFPLYNIGTDPVSSCRTRGLWETEANIGRELRNGKILPAHVHKSLALSTPAVAAHCTPH